MLNKRGGTLNWTKNFLVMLQELLQHVFRLNLDWSPHLRVKSKLLCLLNLSAYLDFVPLHNQTVDSDLLQRIMLFRVDK